jgi:glutamyl-tRNA reductase
MPLICIGINHRTAPVALRERLAFANDEHGEVLRSRSLWAVADGVGLREFALLSTCNRTELYGAAADVTRHFGAVPGGIVEALAEARRLPVAEIAPHLYHHTSEDAVRHLCRVAAGLDSLVLGESEVLGQVATALDLARQVGTSGRVLGAAFHTAIRAGRRARTETGICRCPMSVSSEAVRVLRDTGWDPVRSRVLIVGTGKMSRLAGEVLRANGATDLRVIGRTAAHAEFLGRLLGARPLAWHALTAALREVDVVFCSTSAPHHVVTRERVVAALAGAPADRRLLLVDIAVPRDVEPTARAVPGVTVFDLDDLQRRLGSNLVERQREIPAVEAIIEDEVRQFADWRHGDELRPVLAAMHQQGEEIRQREVARALRHLKDCPAEVRSQLEAFSRSLVNKLLHEPTRRLREETDPTRSDAYVRLLSDLFGLPDAAAEPDAASQREQSAA